MRGPRDTPQRWTKPGGAGRAERHPSRGGAGRREAEPRSARCVSDGGLCPGTSGTGTEAGGWAGDPQKDFVPRDKTALSLGGVCQSERRRARPPAHVPGVRRGAETWDSPAPLSVDAAEVLHRRSGPRGLRDERGSLCVRRLAGRGAQARARRFQVALCGGAVTCDERSRRGRAGGPVSAASPWWGREGAAPRSGAHAHPVLH